MLAATADRLPAALAQLDPGSRALLDLSLRRGISSTEIGELLRKEQTEVERSVEDVLELLADALGLDGDDRREQVREALSELPDEAWQAGPPARSQEPPPAAPPAAPPVRRPARPPSVPRADQPEDLPYFTPREERPKAWPIGLLVLLVSGLVVTAILIFAGGEEADEEGSPPVRGQDSPPAVEGGSEPSPEPQPGEEPRSVRLEPVAGSSAGRGTATLSPDGDRLAISIRGLPRPRGAYEIWIYSSVVDAQSLGSFRDTNIEIDARLTDNLENYRYVDVSREPPDGNPNHSGESVLRAPVDGLLIE